MAELNGRPVDPAELETLALTNYGHFTSFRVEDGRVRGLAHHLDRLDRDCRSLFGTGLDPGRVRDLVRRAIPGTGTVTVRVTVFDPGLDLGHPAAAASPHLLVTPRPAGTLPLPPIRVQSCGYVRDVPEVKNVSLFGSVHRRRAAQQNGFDDVLFVDAGGHVSEGATWNVGFVDGDKIVWPAAACLPGVTMRLIQDQGGDHVVRPVPLAEVASMRTAFATNAVLGVRAISRIDDILFPDQSDILDMLREQYLAIDGDVL